MGSLTLEAIRRAHRRIAPLVHRTPVLTSQYFDRWLGAQLFFKCENFQKIGAFKIRGATNAVLSLPPEQRARGVVTHSSGNHGQALALAAGSHGIPAVVVMPDNSPAVKRAAVRGYGAEVRLCAPTMADRERVAAEVIEERGAVLVHPFDDARIIAGQATAAVELLEEIVGLDLILAPVGGGGLLSGTALAAHYLAPKTAVFGTEPAGAGSRRARPKPSPTASAAASATSPSASSSATSRASSRSARRPSWRPCGGCGSA